jgi:hypothetical protein
MQPDQQNIRPDYDFILNAKQKRGLNLGITSMNRRVVVVIAGFLIFLVFVLIIKNILSGSSVALTDYTSLLQDQSEIIHIMNTDLMNQSQSTVIDSANQAFSQTALLTMTSYQSSMINYLDKNGVKVSKNTLKANISTQIDSEFSSAQSSNNFNSIFQNVLSQQLATYNANLVKTYSNVKGSAAKNMLLSQYKGTQLLLRELNKQYS